MEIAGSGNGNGEKKADKSQRSRQADQGDRGARNQMGPRTRTTIQASRRSRGKELVEQEEPQVELERECSEASSIWARSAK